MTVFSAPADPATKAYYAGLVRRIDGFFALAERARSKGMDVCDKVESLPAMDLADRCEQIIGPKGVADRYRDLFAEENDRMKCIYRIFREILEGKLGGIKERERRLEQAVKTALVLVTEGVVVAPIDGVPQVKISKNFDGSAFVDIYFAGPIRAAGGTATVLPLILGDYARKLMELDRYKPTDEEVERYVEECAIYDEIFSRQYKLSADEVRKIVRGCPVCINGEPTEEREVAVHRNLDRVPGNRVRGGMCLVISEGIALKAMKILNMAKELELEWGWLEEIIKVGKASDSGKNVNPDYKYLGRIAAGRPIFCYPSRFGGFRLRYGRARNTGIMGKALHPATMHVCDDFLSVGVQLKVERPGKSAEVFPCGSLEGPIVRLKNGEVRKLETAREALQVRERVDEILFLGDILVSYGDFRQSAHPLMPAGYCEEWWRLELEKALKERGSGFKVEGVDVEAALKNPWQVNGFDAVELSLQLNVPLHPAYLHYYGALDSDELAFLVGKARTAEKNFEAGKIVGAEFEEDAELKALLEKIGLPHRVDTGKIVVEERYAYPFLRTLGGLNEREFSSNGNIHETLTELSGMVIRDKGGTFIGARMGRPETSRARKMAGNPHVLFPIGLKGGSTRSINKAMESFDARKQVQGKVAVEIALPGGDAKEQLVDVKGLMEAAVERLGTRMPELVKGVKGLINEDKVSEPLEKGILRAQHDIHIFRDGTTRYELLNAPLTHFKPEEIGLSVEKARELGYERDAEGKPLKAADQLLEIYPQDIVIHEDAGEYLVRVGKFCDELLKRFYGLETCYNFSSPADLIGELTLCLAPHTSAAIVGRIIGYTKSRLCFAHPYFHQTKRRNIDGDQDSVMLLMDALLNFSEKYLASSRGGRMDAPLAFTVALDPREIDDEVHNMEVCSSYPLALYEAAQQFVKPDVAGIETVANRLGTEKMYSGIGFTHPVDVFDEGPKMSKYVELKSMEEKMRAQAALQAKIKAVPLKDSLERVLVSHFLPDIIGNARAFSRQTFRCTNCNAKYRRIPLKGDCRKCGGNLILTIAKGSVRKYLEIAKQLIARYGLSDYLRQRIKLIEEEVSSIFSEEKSEQRKLLEFA